MVRPPVALAPLFLLALGAPAEAGSFERRQRTFPRVAAAFERQESAVAARFRDAGAAWPPEGLFLRAFKDEAVLEVWAPPAARGSRRWVHVWTSPLTATSGRLGPKLREGDRQTPEGFFTIDRFNPRSSFHLSLGLDYPTAADRARTRAAADPGSPPPSPGGDIFLHGGAATIGCLPLGDGPIEALYVAAVLARDRRPASPIRVHVFPCRLGTAACEATLEPLEEDDPAKGEFWRSLEPGYESFEETRVPRGPKPGYDRTRQLGPARVDGRS